ncbi:hypothetical protein ACFQ08_37990, partial [Streptosporangium algeriense]
MGPRLTLSHAELDRRTAALARLLRGHRVSPGQVVAVRAQDPVDGLLAMLASPPASAGAVRRRRTRG